jgi:hypothetical protein
LVAVDLSVIGIFMEAFDSQLPLGLESPPRQAQAYPSSAHTLIHPLAITLKT